MQPNSDQQRGGVQVPSSRGHVTPPATRQAATDLMRQQIDKLYDEPQPNEQVATASDQPEENPYDQTHDNRADITAEQQNAAIQAHWQKYHSAWQQYYQMYYERYYTAAVQKNTVAVTKAASAEPQPKEPETFTKDQAVGELRNELLSKIQAQTKKIRKSRHFMPTVVAVFVALIFIFLQYNQIIFANVMAYTSPAALESSSSFIDPNTDVSVDQAPKLVIPEIAVEAPVVYTLGPTTVSNEPLVEQKLQDGVVHYPIAGADAVPGQIGNTVLLGHSANDVFVAGNYKFIFLRLDQLKKGSLFYINYQGKRYTYSVTEKRVISPSQVSELAINNGKPLATLVTCTPVGTSTNRLLVIGEQIAPDPSKATAQTTTTPTTATQEIGGGSKNFFERLFGGS